MKFETALAIVIYFQHRIKFISLTDKEHAAFNRAMDTVFQHAIRALLNTGTYNGGETVLAPLSETPPNPHGAENADKHGKNEKL